MNNDVDGIRRDVEKLSEDAAQAAADLAASPGEKPGLHQAERRLSWIASRAAEIAKRLRQIQVAPSGVGLAWTRLIRFLNAYGIDRKPRVAIAMALVASFGAVTAYRASEEELKAFGCEHRLSEARTYESVQRQIYLDKLSEHERWSDRATVSVGYAQRLLRQGDAIRETGRRGIDPSPDLLDVEAQLELASVRAVVPVRDFTNPALPQGATLERRLRARAQEDVRALGLPSRCSPRDLVKIVAATTDDDYLDPLRQQVDAIHAKSLQDSRSVVAFLFVLVCFTLSEAFVGRLRQVFEWIATILLPLAFCFAAFHSDDRLFGLLVITFLILSGLGPIVWNAIDWLGLGGKRAEPLTAESRLLRYYRIARFVFGIVVATYLALLVTIPVLVARGVPAQWELLVFAAAIIAGVGWITFLAMLLDNVVTSASAVPERAFDRARLPLANTLAVVALFFALPYSLATLPQRHFVGFAIYAALLGASLYILGLSMTRIGWRRFHQPSNVSDLKKRQWLDRTRWYAFSLLVLLAASLAAPGIDLWYTPLILTAIWLCAALIGEHIVHCLSAFRPAPSPDERGFAWRKLEPLQISFAMLTLALVLMTLAVPVLMLIKQWTYVHWMTLVGVAMLSLVVFFFVAEAWSRAHREKLEPASEPGSQSHRDDPTREVVDPATTMEIDPGTPLHSVHFREVRGPFGAAIVVAIAVTAFFSALAGFGYSAEHANASGASDNAAEVQVALLHASTRESARAYHVIDDMAAYEEAHLRSVAATDLGRAAKSGILASDAQPIWDREAQRSSSTIDVLSELSAEDARDRDPLALGGIALNGANGPYHDSSFPEGLFAEATTAATAHELALWDAYDELDSETEVRATKLLGAIALFAIALYLYGQALQMGRRGRAGYFLATFGVVMTACGFVIAITVIPPASSINAIVALPTACSAAEDRVTTTRAEAAALCYSRGELLARLARNQGDFQLAHAAYTAATNEPLRPEFALALYHAVRITSQVATPQTHTSYISIIRRDKLEALIEEDHRVELDLERRDRIIPTSLFDSEGFHQYLQALNKHNDAELANAVALYERDDVNDSTDPSFMFHRGLVELAVGKQVRSQDVYDEVLTSGSQTPELSLAAISDLELLRASCNLGRLRHCVGSDAISATESSIVRASFLPGPLTATLSTHLHGAKRTRLAASVSPGGIAWRLADLRPEDAAAGAPVLIVFRYDPSWKSWYAIPDVSGEVTSAEVTADVKSAAVIGFRSVLAHPSNGGCLDATGVYRVAMYFGGRLVADKDILLPTSAPPLDGVSLREEGVALCYPSGPEGWRREPPSSNTLSEGYSAPDGSRGLRVFGFFSKRLSTPFERSQNEQAMIGRAIDITSYRLRGHSIAAKRYNQAPLRCGYVGIPTGSTRAFTLAHLSMITRAWTNADGFVFVGVVWRDREPTSRAWSPDTLSCSTLASMIPIDLLLSPS
jgi:hypothetical protein